MKTTERKRERERGFEGWREGECVEKVSKEEVGKTKSDKSAFGKKDSNELSSE